MDNLQIFKNEEFGRIRTVIYNGKPYFVASDIARALGYSIPSKAIQTHCKGVSKMEVPTDGGKQEMLIIPEGDIYRLIVKSQMPFAEKFESWVFDEVIPSIRQNGSYITPQAQSLELLQGMLDYMKRQDKEIQTAKDQSQKALETTQSIRSAIIEEFEDWRKDINHKVYALQKSMNKDFNEVWDRLYDELEKRAKCNLSVRVCNAKSRLRQTGAPKSAIDSYRRIDAVQNDPRLKEIFTAIIKEYAVKYAA